MSTGYQEVKHEPLESIASEQLQLPDKTEVFEKLRQDAQHVFDCRDMEVWLEKQVEPHALEVGEMEMEPEVARIDENNNRGEEKEAVERIKEIAGRIEESRNTIFSYAYAGEEKESELQWRLREEEVASRERISFEHQAMEAELLTGLESRYGELQRVPHDPFSWTVEWNFAPQEFSVNISSIRGLRDKLRDGYHVLLVSIYDRVGGSCLRFSTGEKNRDCNAAVQPMRFESKSSGVDRFINRSVDLLCPAPALLGTHSVLLFELWQLRVGKYDPVDKVVGFGYWPLVNRDYRVVEGKFKCALLTGEASPAVDTFHQMNGLIQDGLQYWLGNIYFEIKHTRQARDKLESDIREEQQRALFETEKMTSDTLRLERTADDIRSLTFPNLPPRLFFDDVKLEDNDELKKATHTEAGDLRDMNVALWEKRAMLEEEKETLRDETRKRKSRSLMMDNTDDLEVAEMLIRKDLNNRGATTRTFRDVVYAEKETKKKKRDSHVLLGQHHIALVSQREFFFMGRRWRDKGAVAWSVVRDDFGYNPGGPWDKTKIVTSVIFAIMGFYIRMIVHGVGKYLYLQFLDVPLTKEEWNFYHIDLRFEHTSRFYLIDTTILICIGNAVVIFFFVFLALVFLALIKIFHTLPYFMTRFGFWFGVAACLDAPITTIQEAAAQNFDSGEPFLLYNQIEREEQSGWYGAILTVVLYAVLAMPQVYFVFLYSIYVHLNARAIDIYKRITYPETSFFLPHDMELSDLALRQLVKRARKYRSEKGEIKRVVVNEFNHKYTCLFRDRLFKLLSILSDNPDEWIIKYCDRIALRRPKWAEDQVVHNLGTFELGSDILTFMKRNFPHMCQMSSKRVGDRDEDYYYEWDVIRGITSHSTALEDDLEMRDFLKAYFTAQIYGEKPVSWDMEGSPGFNLKDKQLLADLIFFETSYAPARLLLLHHYLGDYATNFIFGEDEKQLIELPNFDRSNYLASVEGPPARGVIVNIIKENHASAARELARAFIITPTGSIIEPSPEAFSYLSEHTADHPEFWAAKASIEADELRQELERSARY